MLFCSAAVKRDIRMPPTNPARVKVFGNLLIRKSMMVSGGVNIESITKLANESDNPAMA